MSCENCKLNKIFEQDFSDIMENAKERLDCPRALIEYLMSQCVGFSKFAYGKGCFYEEGYCYHDWLKGVMQELIEYHDK